MSYCRLKIRWVGGWVPRQVIEKRLGALSIGKRVGGWEDVPAVAPTPREGRRTRLALFRSIVSTTMSIAEVRPL